MKIATLELGSLIWKPRSLKLKGKWNNDGALLPIEFVRISNNGRLTPVRYQPADLITTSWLEIASLSYLCQASVIMTVQGKTSIIVIDQYTP